MLPFPLIYHDRYDLHFGKHVFPTQKYKLIRRRLLDTFVAGPEDFLTPEPATGDQLRLAHSDEWIRKLETGTLSYHEIVRLEAPYSRQMVEAYFHSAGGTILAARKALDCGIGINLGGGFHHAFRDHGEGFCAVNDVAVAVRVLQQDGLIRKALVVDCDVHHGNGTASIFANDPAVFTFSMHQSNNYPAEKPPSSLDIHLEDGTGDHEYLQKLSDALVGIMAGFAPDLVLYVAGSDPYYDDQLGGLALTMEGMRERDRLVFEASLRRQTPICVTLAGGYACTVEDTVQLHSNTVLAAVDALAERGWRKS